MCRCAAWVCALLVAGCGGLTPVDPPLMGANEMQVKPGMFSGPYGEFVLVGDKTAPPNPIVTDEVGAGS